MDLSVTGVTTRLRSPDGQKFLKYSAASVVAVIVSVVLLALFDGVLRWGPVWSSTLATGIAAIPSYVLNRRWAWGKNGRSHLWREVVPFWVLAFIGWAFSTYSLKLTSQLLAHSALSHLVRTGIDEVVYVGAFGILWIVKFVIYNKFLFADEESSERTDGAGGHTETPHQQPVATAAGVD